MLTVAVANFHSPAAPLPLGSQFEVEGDKFGHLKGVLQARTFAPPEIVFRPIEAHQIEKIPFHLRTPAGFCDTNSRRHALMSS